MQDPHGTDTPRPAYPGRNGFTAETDEDPTPELTQYPVIVGSIQETPVYLSNPAAIVDGRMLKGCWTRHREDAWQFASWSDAVACFLEIQRLRWLESLRIQELVAAPDRRTGMIRVAEASRPMRPPVIAGQLSPAAATWLRQRQTLFGLKEARG